MSTPRAPLSLCVRVPVPVSLTDGPQAVTMNVASLPCEPAERSSPPDWRSVGEAAGSVLISLAYRCASRAYPILHEEGGERAEIAPLAAPAD